jgi:hypothetical protein
MREHLSCHLMEERIGGFCCTGTDDGRALAAAAVTLQVCQADTWRSVPRSSPPPVSTRIAPQLRRAVIRNVDGAD